MRVPPGYVALALVAMGCGRVGYAAERMAGVDVPADADLGRDAGVGAGGPTPPMNPAAQGCADAVFLSWMGTPGGARLELRPLEPGAPWETLAQLEPGVSSYVDETAGAGVDFAYRVRALAGGEVSAPLELGVAQRWPPGRAVVVLTTDPAPGDPTPAAPTDLALTAGLAGTDPPPIRSVAFRAGTRVLGTVEAPGPFQLDLPEATGAFYDLSAEATFVDGCTLMSPQTRIALDGVYAGIQFGDERPLVAFSDPPGFLADRGGLPPGYLRDLGEAFGDRDFGLRFGWDQTVTTFYRPFNENLPDARYHASYRVVDPDRFWELEVPPGSYRVRGHAGYNAFEFRNVDLDLAIEGRPFIVARTETPVFGVEETLTEVVVTDGRLTFSGSTSDGRGHLEFLEIATEGSDYQPPSPPGELTADLRRSHSLQLHFRPGEDNTGVVGHRVYRDGAPIGETPGARFYVGGLQPDRTYRFTVTALDAWGNESEPSSELVAETSPAPDAVARARGSLPAPVLDGVDDDALWEGLDRGAVDNPLWLSELPALTVPDDAADLSARFALGWDDAFLYLLVVVSDELLLDPAAEPRRGGDFIELYLDFDGERTLGMAPDSLQLRFPWNGEEALDADLDGDGVSRPVSAGEGHFALAAVPGGWVLEAALPWARIAPADFRPRAGTTLGFELHVQDDDTTGDDDRDGKVGFLEATIDGVWTSPQRLATMVLAGP